MAARLLVCEVGGALLGKGRHALFLVGKREGAVEAAPLEAQPLPLRQLVRGVDTLLGRRAAKKADKKCGQISGDIPRKE